MESVNRNIQRCYNAGTYLCDDKQAVIFHRPISFRHDIPSKQGGPKFGYKILWICDAETDFSLKSLVHVGQSTLTEEERGSSNSISEVIRGNAEAVHWTASERQKYYNR